MHLEGKVKETSSLFLFSNQLSLCIWSAASVHSLSRSSSIQRSPRSYLESTVLRSTGFRPWLNSCGRGGETDRHFQDMSFPCLSVHMVSLLWVVNKSAQEFPTRMNTFGRFQWGLTWVSEVPAEVETNSKEDRFSLSFLKHVLIGMMES